MDEFNTEQITTEQTFIKCMKCYQSADIRIDGARIQSGL